MGGNNPPLAIKDSLTADEYDRDAAVQRQNNIFRRCHQHEERNECTHSRRQIGARPNTLLQIVEVELTRYEAGTQPGVGRGCFHRNILIVGDGFVKICTCLVVRRELEAASSEAPNECELSGLVQHAPLFQSSLASLAHLVRN